MGLQGRAAIADLARSKDVQDVVCVDIDSQGAEKLARIADMRRVHMESADMSSKSAILALLRQGFDVAIDLLPFPLMRNAFEAAIEAGVPLVSTNYAKTVRDLHGRAAEAGVSIMPECGLDPGIDLVLFGRALRQFDRLRVLDSYCGGFPERRACDNAISYKVSWNWEMVLSSQWRDSVFIVDGKRREIPAKLQHDNPFIHNINIPGLGELEAVPNGDAAIYTDLLGVSSTIERTSRYLLRWPGWSAFWRPLKQLGFLSQEPVPGLPGAVSPRQMVAALTGPQLRYRDDEKDLVVMYNVFQGDKDGQAKTVVNELLIERDLETGLLAMSIGVGYPASIVAQMLGRGEIRKKGILSPVTDVPCDQFLKEIARRGIQVTEKVIVEGRLAAV
jgi:saccharopine dehydrogenase-like NADP-dependent oxidoreductase